MTNHMQVKNAELILPWNTDPSPTQLIVHDLSHDIYTKIQTTNIADHVSDTHVTWKEVKGNFIWYKSTADP